MLFSHSHRNQGFTATDVAPLIITSHNQPAKSLPPVPATLGSAIQWLSSKEKGASIVAQREGTIRLKLSLTSSDSEICVTVLYFLTWLLLNDGFGEDLLEPRKKSGTPLVHPR